MMFGGIEAGGTKFVLAVADDNLKIVVREHLDTTQPEAMMPVIIDFFTQHPVTALGIGSFGPIGVNPQQADYGYIKKTPKPGWADYPFLPRLQDALNIPIYWTTDVNVAAYGEMLAGAAQGKKNLVYITVGTGIGAGIIADGQIYSGISHPEVGHLLMHTLPDDHFAGVCPYHQYCLEGIAAGPAIAARNGRPGRDITRDDPFWQVEAYYLAQACVDLTLTLAPEMIVFGGGVANQQQLMPLIRSSFITQLNGYVDTPPVDNYIVHAGLGNDAGIVGSLLLAKSLVAKTVNAPSV
ncbi:MAG: ROK family protein [Schleiferilactobacillus harbinensis]|jgi:fructokinase|nr:ROK family protein [Schleiferilactobacillus harbinensis]MCI1912105.1 ROK family protein [Schleiferilactobacillus harbinensis]